MQGFLKSPKLWSQLPGSSWPEHLEKNYSQCKVLLYEVEVKNNPKYRLPPRPLPGKPYPSLPGKTMSKQKKKKSPKHDFVKCCLLASEVERADLSNICRGVFVSCADNLKEV